MNSPTFLVAFYLNLAPCTFFLAPCTLNLAPITSIDPVKDPRWDQFVESHPFGYICHLSGWKQVLEESFPHMKGHYLALLNHDNNSIRAALPVFEVKSILTGKRLVSIPFATNCDPLISSNEDMIVLLDAAINLSIKLRCSKVEIRTLASWPLIQDGRIGSVVYNKCHQLSLEAGPEEIIKTYRRQFRQQINKSLKSGLELQIAGNETGLREFYHFYVKARKRLGLPPQPYLFLNLSPFGRTFNPGVFHGLPVTIGTTKNRHFHFSSLEFSKAELEINDRFVDPHLTPAPGTAVVVLLRRGAKGNILPFLQFLPCFQLLVRICPF